MLWGSEIVAPFAMTDDLSHSLQRADLTHPSHDFKRPIRFELPFHAKLEVPVGVDARGIDGKLCHLTTPQLSLNLPSHLLDGDDDKFRRLERREADHHIDDAEIDVILRRGLGIDLDEVGIACLLTLKRTLPKEVVHESTGGQADLRPQRFVVGFEDYKFKSPVQALFDKQGQ